MSIRGCRAEEEPQIGQLLYYNGHPAEASPTVLSPSQKGLSNTIPWPLFGVFIEEGKVYNIMCIFFYCSQLKISAIVSRVIQRSLGKWGIEMKVGKQEAMDGQSLCTTIRAVHQFLSQDVLNAQLQCKNVIL